MQQDQNNTLNQGQAPKPINLQEPTQTTQPAQVSNPVSLGSQDSGQLDPTIVNMARAIKHAETSGSSSPYTAPGKSGEYGAYQYTEQTWNADSQKYLGQSVPLTQASVAQQNEVAYKKIADLKAQGYKPDQVASIWNHGSPDYQGVVGVHTNPDGSKVNYDTPTYVKRVVDAYNSFKQGNIPDSTDISSEEMNSSDSQGKSESGLLSQLGGRAKDIGSNMSDLANQLQGQPGSQGWWSDLLQSGGDVAGGIGDVINAGINLIPGVKGAENWLGGEVGKAADTQVGQSVVKSIQAFQQAHPELSKDIGAGFNIITAIPILKGLGVIMDVAASGLGTALKSAGEKAVLNDMTDMAGSTAKGVKFMSDNPDVMQTIVKNGLHNDFDFVDGKLSTAGANESAWKKITDLNKQIKPILDQPKFSTIGADGESIAKKALENAPNSGLTTGELIQNAKDLDPMNKLLWDKFEAGQANMSEINSLRSSLDSKVKSVFTDDRNVSNSKELGGMLSSAMRDYVQSSAPETKDLFKQMSELFKAQKAFKPGILEGKKLKTGLGRKILGYAAKGAIGGLVGSIGGPVGSIAGFLAGETLPTGGLFAKKTLGGTLGKLASKSGTEGLFQKVVRGTKGASMAAGGALSQKLKK